MEKESPENKAQTTATAPKLDPVVKETPSNEGSAAANTTTTSSSKTNKAKASSKQAAGADVTNKYNKLKKRYRHLREEYTRILESWEASARSIKTLLEERKFLKKKLETFFKSQHFIDDQVFATANNPPTKSAGAAGVEAALNNQVKNTVPQVKTQATPVQGNGTNTMSSILHMNPNQPQNAVRMANQPGTAALQKPSGFQQQKTPQQITTAQNQMQYQQQMKAQQLQQQRTQQMSYNQTGQANGAGQYSNQMQQQLNRGAQGMVNGQGYGQANQFGQAYPGAGVQQQQYKANGAVYPGQGQMAQQQQQQQQKARTMVSIE